MAKPFLYYVAEDILRKYGNNLTKVAVVFPNKRASLFLGQELARLTDKPIWSPTYITISDLFRQHSQLEVGDPIKLICDLYKVFAEATHTTETLDQFYSWGQILLSDFDDIDKNMAPARQIFRNIDDLHDLDDTSYLTEEQKEWLRKFFGIFAEPADTPIKKNFRTIWNELGNIYSRYREVLAEQGLAYEGQLYREVAENADISFRYNHYLFVGFNMMQEVELEICQRLKKEQKAHFYWDFDSYYMPKNGRDIHEAGHYISRYMTLFPNELDNSAAAIYRNIEQKKHISYLASATENMQARYIGQWLRENDRIKDGRKTAIVMCDEKLLQSITHNIPQEVDKINITIGFPLQQTPVVALVKLLITLQLQGFRHDTQSFRMSWVNRVLQHPYATYLSAEANDLLAELRQVKRFYVTPEKLWKDVGTQQLFRHQESTADLANWLTAMMRMVGTNYALALKSGAVADNDPLLQESIFRIYSVLNRLANLINSGSLLIDFTTYQRLLYQLIQTTTIPFHGEPVVGVQVMGVLETRNLDFEHLLILSCNEGNMPKGVNDNSFIPYSIRKAFGLTTIDHKVGIYSYYFNRMLQRAGDITIAYNNATTDGHTGEMSRFMLQWLVESNHPIHRLIMSSDQAPKVGVSKPVAKDAFVKAELEQISRLSPTAINAYIRCQLLFYYRYIAHIAEPDRNDETVDNRAFGNIFHKAAELFYTPYFTERKPVTKVDIEYTLNKKQVNVLQRLVDEAFRLELFKTDVRHRVEYNGLQYINREVIISYLRQLLQVDLALVPFYIQGLEKKMNATFEFETGNGNKQLEIYGSIDRLDQVRQESGSELLRVVDYKTGSNDKIKVKDVESIFTGENLHNHTDYFLQTMLYSILVRENEQENPKRLPVSPSIIFIQHVNTEDYDPTLKLDGKKMTDIIDYTADFKVLLRKKLAELFDPGIDFMPTEDKSRCVNCPYIQICKN